MGKPIQSPDRQIARIRYYRRLGILYAHHWPCYIELRLATQTHAQRSGFVASYRRYDTCGLLRESEINTI